MPREIIDTATSRPAYVRRRLVTTAATIVVLLALAFIIWTVFGHHPSVPMAAVPGKLAH